MYKYTTPYLQTTKFPLDETQYIKLSFSDSVTESKMVYMSLDSGLPVMKFVVVCFIGIVPVCSYFCVKVFCCCWKFIYTFKTWNLVWRDSTEKTYIFVGFFLCAAKDLYSIQILGAACLPASLIMYVPISELQYLDQKYIKKSTTLPV